jgi:hypothetical protein
VIVTAVDFDRYLWATSLAVDAGFSPRPLGGNSFEIDVTALDVLSPAVTLGAVSTDAPVEAPAPTEPPSVKRAARRRAATKEE